MSKKLVITTLLGLLVVGLGAYVFIVGEPPSLGDGAGDYFSEQRSTTTSSETQTGSYSPRSVIGKSVQGRDIAAYTYGNGSRHIIFVGAIHGGYEWNTVLLSRRLMDYIEANPAVVPSNLTVTVIPILNPDGFFRVVGTVGAFTSADVPVVSQTEPGRFNARGVDLNRNFACNWQSESRWQNRTVNAGSVAFSEPEARALRDFVQDKNPRAVILFHSAADGVYGASCEGEISPAGRELMNIYANASGYPAVESFDFYEITGDAEGWLAKIGVPSVSVELTTHETVEWPKNKAGIEAVFNHYAR